MFFYKMEGHMPKLSSFGRGKTIRPKKSLTSLLHAALQLQHNGNQKILLSKTVYYCIETISAGAVCSVPLNFKSEN